MTDTISVQTFTGEELSKFIPAVAQLRIEVFRDFPYLYDGNREYEDRYLKRYIESQDSVIAIAFDGDEVIGASTAIPLRHESDYILKPFLDSAIDPDDVFYLGESVLKKNYRGRGIGVRFFEERERHAKHLGGFRCIAFCAVERPLDHPNRPRDYVPLDEFWRHRGYEKDNKLKAVFKWKDLNDQQETEKSMVFWLKWRQDDNE